jgi:hypothetical protein
MIIGKNCSFANKPVPVLQQQLVFCYCIKSSNWCATIVDGKIKGKNT